MGLQTGAGGWAEAVQLWVPVGKENVTEGGSSSGGGLGSPQCMVAVGFHGYKDGRMAQQGGWRL